MKTSSKNTATLILTCPDQMGLVAAVSRFLFDYGGNILHADQHQDEESKVFLMRIEWDLNNWILSEENFDIKFQPVASRFKMNWRLSWSTRKAKVAILVSQFDHCLADILYRGRIGELDCEIALVISNHPGAHELTQFYRLPFHFIPIEQKDKATTENLQMELLYKNGIDLIILARYMQILSPKFVTAFESRIINIHHSFLPAFIGARPYHQAFAKGVKLIGATSHYVTPDLDEGPIIHQDVVQISHRDQVSDLIRKGRDLERLVLSKAVKWHLENRIVIYDKKTIIFD
jgi:formyltetrahydrofolate deformylase